MLEETDSLIPLCYLVIAWHDTHLITPSTTVSPDDADGADADGADAAGVIEVQQRSHCTG